MTKEERKYCKYQLFYLSKKFILFDVLFQRQEKKCLKLIFESYKMVLNHQKIQINDKQLKINK